MPKQPITCNLIGGASVVFDVEDSTAADFDFTASLYHMFATTVGK